MLGFIIAIILAIVFLTLLFRKIYVWNFVQKQKKYPVNDMAARIADTKKEFGIVSYTKGQLFKQKLIKQVKELPFIGLSDRRAEQYKLAIEAADLKRDGRLVKPEELYFDQITAVVILFLICFVLSFLTRFAWLGLIATPFAFNLPIRAIKNRINAVSTSVKYSFPKFYDSVYVQFKEKETNTLLRDIVESHIPFAEGDFKKVLIRFAMDLESGEIYALDKLRDRYEDDPIICKFCSVMKLRIYGDEASFVALKEFRKELQKDIEDWMMDDLKKRKEKVNRMLGITVSIFLAIVMIVYMYNLIVMAT